MPAVLPLDAVSGQQGPVTHLLNRNLAVLHRIDAIFHHYILIPEPAVDSAVGLSEHLIRIVLPVLQETGELVCAQASAYSTIPQALGTKLRYLP